MNRLSWQAVFFDFDGVIADSVQVKTQAFATMFAPYGQQVAQQAVAYHLANGGMPRFKKFIYYYKELLGMDIDQTTLEQKGKEFSAMVMGGVIAAELIPGALACLQQLQQQHIPAFVVSGTPHEEMETIVHEKGLSHYFLEVHGSPRTKTVIVEEIINRHGFLPEKCLFIGDALADHTAAVNTGTAFLAIKRPGSTVDFPDDTILSAEVRLDLPS
ncbi:HAD family hydrolase [Desulfogranum marinum]|uniref:HAD family hydrolase n=1 Tax=Desulfogranum marinum TaxID=453220 RepID=UPI0029C819D8|nr:HAD family hydrolase [Desulfogranum marinum]